MAAPAAAAAAANDVQCFTAFNKSTVGLHGFDMERGYNLKKIIQEKEHDLGSTHDFAHFELGRATKCPVAGSAQFAVATDTPEASQHFLAVLDAETMLKSAGGNPLVCYLRLDKHLSDLRWLNDEMLIGCAGQGDLILFQFDGQKVVLKGAMKDASKSNIRELSVQPGATNRIAFGGFDQTLCFTDLSTPQNPYTHRIAMPGAVSSVKWAEFHGGHFVSSTTDDGKFYLFDARTNMNSSESYHDSGKEDLYTHERYNEFGVLLGFGDGEIHHIDMRHPQHLLHTTQDPFVEAIGNIEFNTEAQAFVVSGFTDFTVWKVKGGVAGVYSHSDNSEKTRKGDGYECKTIWYDANTVLSSDNAGAISLFRQGF